MVNVEERRIRERVEACEGVSCCFGCAGLGWRDSCGNSRDFRTEPQNLIVLRRGVGCDGIESELVSFIGLFHRYLL